MKSILKSVLLAFVVLGQSAVAAPNQPLMVIRFVNPFVDYQSSLNKAVVSAVHAKKDVVFEVMAGNGAGNGGVQIAQDINKMGVTPANIHLRPSGLNNNEVLVFVR